MVQEVIIGISVVITMSIAVSLLKASNKSDKKEIERPEFIRLMIGGRKHHGKNR